MIQDIKKTYIFSLKDVLVEKGPIRDNNINFPKDKENRHFSTNYYKTILPNGEQGDRKWLVYSKDFDRVFCFCCKLFSTTNSTHQLDGEGSRDWKNLSSKLKSHETTHEHITHMHQWSELKMRLSKNKTIDENIQKQINKEREHWRNVLLRIIAVIKNLAKNNIAFRGKNEKIYEDNNGIFLSIIEMIAELIR